MPTTYRKKPVEVEAIQWDGTNLLEMMEFAGEHMEYFSRVLRIFTPDGPVIARKGDYVIKETKTKFYPCKPDIFKMMYEEIETKK